MNKLIKSLLFFIFTTIITLNNVVLGMTDEKMGQKLFNAVRNKDLEQTQNVIFAIYKRYPKKPQTTEKSGLVLKILNSRGFYNLSPLMVATIQNDDLIIKELLTTAGVLLNKADFEEFINAKDKANLTALDITTSKVNTWKERTIKETRYIDNLLKQAIAWNADRKDIAVYE